MDERRISYYARRCTRVKSALPPYKQNYLRICFLFEKIVFLLHENNRTNSCNLAILSIFRQFPGPHNVYDFLKFIIHFLHSTEYCRNMWEIFPIFHYNWNIVSTFLSNIAKYFIATLQFQRSEIFLQKKIFNSFRNIVKRFRWNVPILHILLIFQNVANDESFFLKLLYY